MKWYCDLWASENSGYPVLYLSPAGRLAMFASNEKGSEPIPSFCTCVYVDRKQNVLNCIRRYFCKSCFLKFLLTDL